MAKKDYKVYHKRSSVVQNGIPKLPTSAQTEYGEIAINYAADNEVLSIRNTRDEIITFSPTSKLLEIERVTAAALNDLDERVKSIVNEIIDIKERLTQLENS